MEPTREQRRSCRDHDKMQLLTSLKRRWDSSDPERAPPPLPLNPGVGSPTTKANTSAGIAAAAKQIVERARESRPLSSYTSNDSPQTSPEKSLIKGAHHKRMQSLQPGSVKDLRSYLDGNRSPERSPERPASRENLSVWSRQNSREDISSPVDRSTTPTPAPRDLLKDTPTLRPTTRQPPRPLLGENTPPSATMLALQTMQVPEPLTDVTNGPSTPSPVRVNTTYDFSSQLLNLTSIATSLQREMAQLSRRSKDNATDLISLKEATNQRDEDIRRSLRDLATSVSTTNLLGPPPVPGAMSRSASSFGANFLDNKPFNSPESASKAWSVPRAASAHSFMEDARAGSPSPFSVEGAASVAMLEKIIREMVTKDGQERLLSTLSELLEKSRNENNNNARKVEELADFIKEKSETQALVSMPKDAGPPRLELNFDSPSHLAKITREGAKEPDDQPPNKDIMSLLNRIKESVQHSGGTTSEVKTLVRDLRGEVLGMGRELGKKLDRVSETQLNTTLDRGIQDGQGSQHAEEVQRIVEEGMAELKEQLTSILAQRAEQDDDTFKQLAVARSAPDGDEMFAVVKHALAEHAGSELGKPTDSGVGLDHDGVLEAVKEGLKDFEPNIELQQFGLERDEILAVLKEGLEEHHQNKPDAVSATIDKGEIYEVMQEALKDFHPAFPAEAMSQMRDEILSNVREALSSYQPSVTASAVVPSMDDEATRAAVIEAVKEGLANHGPNAARELEISRDDLFDAVKASLDGSAIPFGSFGSEVLAKMQQLVDNMHIEFQQYSAANGRDTEQVLDAMKDGLESLKTEVESYVDRAQDVTGKDEIVDTVKGGLEQLRVDVQGYCASGPAHDGGRAEMLDYIKAEFEHMHEAIANNVTSRDIENDAAARPDHTAAIILAIKEGMDSLKSQVNDTATANRELEIEMPTEELVDAMKVEFEQLEKAIMTANAINKDELVETMQESLGALQAKVGSLGGSELSAGGAMEEVINEMHAEFNALKEALPSIIGADADRDAIVAGVRQSIEDMRAQLAGDQSETSAEALAAIKEELERFREGMNSSLVLGGGPVDNAEALADHSAVLEGIHAKLDEVRDRSIGREGSTNGVPDELLESLRGEFENLRISLASSLVHGGSNEEILETIRLGLDDLRSHIDKKLENPGHANSDHDHLIDAINDGLESMRTDIVKTLDKPLDMTVNYEILDTLKDGIAGLRADIDILKTADGRPITPKGGEIVLADGAEVGEASREIPIAAAAGVAGAVHEMNRSDIEGMEVLLAQLQIKIEAMNGTLQDMPAMHTSSADTAAAMKDGLGGLEAMIRAVQGSVVDLAAKEMPAPPAPEGAAMKEDTDALETLLRNTKAQLEEMVLPDPATAVTKEHLDAVEAVVRITNESIDGLAEKLENTTATKTDVAVVEVLAQDVKAALEELSARMPAPTPDDEKPELMTKADLDILGVICTEIKVKVNDLVLPDPDDLPSKSEIEQLQGLIVDFRDSHDKLKDSYETDIAVTAKAFDDRKQEFEDTILEISGVKDSLAELKEELLVKLGDSETGIDALGETLRSVEEQNGNHEPVIAEVKEVMEALSREFDRTHGSLESIKVDHQQSAESSLEKQAEHKASMVTEIGERLDTLFDGLMSKYDDAQHAAEEKAKVMEEKANVQEELLNSTKAMADDLRLSIDTLGTALTSFTATFPDQMEKMAEESKTVFNRIDDTYNKLDETQEGLKYEHNATREEVVRVMAAIGGVQSDLTEHNPRFMMTLNEVKALIGQHYEHSQKASDAATEHQQAVLEQLKASLEESQARHEDQTRELKTALPTLMPATAAVDFAQPAAQVEKFDDSALHEKLDKLVGHAETTTDSSVQLERLDQIHEKVMATAAEVSAFVAAQAKQITADHESKEKEAEEVALLLERRMVQKDEIEDDITVLNAEKESLRNAVEAMKAETEALAAQKSRLNAEVSSLETALHIRRDELHEMDRKAETIERRMLEGVMNQSRMLLMAKSAKSSPKKKPQGRDLRIPSNASAASAQTTVSSMPGLKANHALALKSRPSVRRNGPLLSTPERRIMSLNQITHNVPNGAKAFSATPSLISNSPAGLKRSHSVKTQFMRKPSWAGKRNLSLAGENKENDILSEEDEEETQHPQSRDGDHEDLGSETATERRTSYMSGTETALTRDDASHTDGITPGTDDGRRMSYGTSDLSYGTGSYITGSEIDRRTSLASSTNGMLGLEAPHEEHVEANHDAEATTGAERTEEEGHQFQLEAAPKEEEHKNQIKPYYAPPSDSGLGTDLPTAALSASEGEYFRSIPE